MIAWVPLHTTRHLPPSPHALRVHNRDPRCGNRDPGDSGLQPRSHEVALSRMCRVPRRSSSCRRCSGGTSSSTYGGALAVSGRGWAETVRIGFQGGSWPTAPVSTGERGSSRRISASSSGDTSPRAEVPPHHPSGFRFVEDPESEPSAPEHPSGFRFAEKPEKPAVGPAGLPVGGRAPGLPLQGRPHRDAEEEGQRLQLEGCSLRLSA